MGFSFSPYKSCFKPTAKSKIPALTIYCPKILFVNMKKYIYLLLFVSLFTFDISRCFSQTPTQEWVARYNSPHSENDRFEEIVLDKFGNAYLTGWNLDSINGNDIITVKINSSGQIVWSQVYNSGGPGSNDIGKAITIDDSGNVYVTGYTGMNLGPYNIITIKYDDLGIMKWFRIYTAETSEAFAIKTDMAGNIYVTGGTGRAITIKYNTNGDTLWIRKYFTGSFSVTTCLTIDRLGMIYTAGYVEISNHSNALIMKYDSSGNLLWGNYYDNGGFSQSVSIAVDSVGNGAITGSFTPIPMGNSNYYTLRFTATGNTIWQKYYNGGTFDDYATSVAIDKIGNTYVTGSSWGSTIDYVTIKYNLLGDTIWTRRYNGPAGSYDQAYSLCLDEKGNCYVTGASIGTGSGDDYATIKYDSTGFQKWVVRYNGPANGGDGAGSVILGNNNTIYVGGESDGIGTGKDLAVIKYDQLIEITKNTNNIPVYCRLFQNYPNPFNSSTVVSYELPKRGNVNLSLFNSLGQLVKIIVKGNKDTGYYSIIINSDNLSSGIYFYKITVDNKFIDTKKLVIIK